MATRQGSYFHRAVPVDNGTAPQHPEIKVQALLPDAGPGGVDLKMQETGRGFLPKTPESFTYDLDGNLTADGRWTYTWDHENRLVAMESLATVPATAKRKLEFAYDSNSRRIRKRVHGWNGTTYVLSSERRYLYDGWNLVAEVIASPTPFVKTYVWGLDLSGSEQGAGGVGGLLVVRQGGESHYPAYDGNGNVMALVRASDGQRSARYEYGAFGELLEVEEEGVENPFRFSTKFWDGETGLCYYGYRYFNPEIGRWLSRDPIGERGGVNVYGFVANDGVRNIDVLGESILGPLFGLQECGKIGYQGNPDSFGRFDFAITWALTPHMFIETEDGVILDHFNPKGKSRDHWSTYFVPIEIPTCTNCDEFSECLKSEYSKCVARNPILGWPGLDGDLSRDFNTCQTFVADAVWACQRRIKKTDYAKSVARCCQPNSSSLKN